MDALIDSIKNLAKNTNMTREMFDSSVNYGNRVADSILIMELKKIIMEKHVVQNLRLQVWMDIGRQRRRDILMQLNQNGNHTNTCT